MSRSILFYKSLFCTTLLGIAGCAPTIAPVEQVQPQSLANQSRLKIIDARQTVEYLCEGEKNVRIQQVQVPKEQKITLFFNHTSHKLSPAVSKVGKKYSNIRWIWQEDANGVGTLLDNRQNLLATGCIRRNIQ